MCGSIPLAYVHKNNIKCFRWHQTITSHELTPYNILTSFVFFSPPWSKDIVYAKVFPYLNFLFGHRIIKLKTLFNLDRINVWATINANNILQFIGKALSLWLQSCFRDSLLGHISVSLNCSICRTEINPTSPKILCMGTRSKRMF